jgi:hypothetical protein
MSTDSIINPQIFDKQHDLELLKMQSEELNLAEQLGLRIPHEVTVEEKQLWKIYFNTLLHGYQNQLLDETDIPDYINKFELTPSVSKLMVNNKLYNAFEQKIEDNGYLREVIAFNDIANSNKNIAKKLDDEGKENFYYYMNTDQVLTPEIRQAFAEEEIAESEAESYERLSRAFDSKQTLNIGLREPQKGKALTPDQVAAKFNLEQSIASDEDEEVLADDKDPMAKISSQTQSLYELVKLNRDRLTKEARNKKIFSQSEIDEDIATRVRSKPAGLDELLKK